MSSILSLLGDSLRKPDGSTISTADAVGSKSVLALYFSAHWCPPCRGFTPELCKKYTALKEAGKDYEMVFVSSDKDEAAFNEYHNEMSFLALPFALRDEKAKLSKKFKVQGIPSLVFYDLKNDKIITTDGREGISATDFIDAFPYTPEEFSFDLMGPELRTPTGEMVKATTALDKDVIGLYFSAHWCPPCKAFTPTLSAKYKGLLAAGKSFEMLFVSSDRDEAAFNEYHESMSFLALPYANRAAKEKLSTMFKVQGIPTLVFVDRRTNEVICGNGRGAISSDTYIEDFPYHPKPMYDMSESLDGINDEVSLVVLMENADAATKESLSQLLLSIAVDEAKKPEDDRIAGKFFTAKGGGPVDRVRAMCGVPEGKDPTLLMLNFDDEGAHYHPLPEHKEVTKETIYAFLKAYKDGKLNRRTPS